MPGRSARRSFTFALTRDPHWRWWGTQRLRPSRRTTPTLTVSLFL